MIIGSYDLLLCG